MITTRAAFTLLTPLCLFFGSAGCAELAVYSPFRRAEFEEEKKWGENPTARLRAIHATGAALRTAAPSQQEQLTQQLLKQLSQEQNILMRTALIRALGPSKSPGAVAAVRDAAADRDSRVRIAACESLAQHGAQSGALLGQMVAADKDLDVRIAATKALGQVKGPEAMPGLAAGLDDPNPALQHRAILSLKEATGKDYGGDLAAWRQLVRGEAPAASSTGPSLADRMRSLF